MENKANAEKHTKYTFWFWDASRYTEQLLVDIKPSEPR